MHNSYTYRRLADKSAFVVFDSQSYKTYIIQNIFMFDFFKNKEIAIEQSKFDDLNIESQIELLISSGIKEEFI